MEGNYQEAVRYFEKKDYQAAHVILLGLIKKQPNNVEVLYFLAIIKSKEGEYNSAIPLFQKVISLKEDHTEAYYNLALCFQYLEKKEDALNYYQKAIELNPYLSEAYNNIAIIYKSMEKYDEAESAFEKAVKVKPGNTSAISNISGLSLEKNNSKEYNEAVQFFKDKKFAEAKVIISELLGKNPGNLQLLTSLGIIYFNTKDYDDSITCYTEILKKDNNRADAHYGLAICYQNTENFDPALNHYKKAIELKPDYVEAFNNLGLLYSELINTDEAVKCYQLALKYNPEYCNALINLGGIKLNRDDFDGAMECFNKALNQLLKDKNNIENTSMTFTNIGVVHFRKRDINEAIKYFNKGIELNPENLVAHYNKAEALLISEQFEEGWKEYEWRKDRKDFGKRKFNNPLLPEINIEGKKVLVYAEQGLGDALQFLRYIPTLKKRGCRIIFECGKEMHPLLNNYKWIDEIIERNTNEAPDIEYDYEIPLLSLPLYFNTNKNNIPAHVPYLNADNQLKEKWSEIVKDEKKVKIGIVWAGNPKHSNDRHRSVRLQRFLPLLSIEGTHFYSLQKGYPVIQVKDYHLLLTDLDDHLKSFADTAAVIENLDLVITVDTSVAHLAGALGKETWVLIPFMSDWRWLLEGDNSEWYPTMKLYRQPAFQDWNSVFLILKHDLIKYVKNKRIGITKIQNNNEKPDDFNDLISELIKQETKHKNIFKYELDEIVLKEIDIKPETAVLNLGYHGNIKEKIISNNLEERDLSNTAEKYYFHSNGKRYDFIIANNILQYSLSPYHTLTELKKILNHGGNLLIVVPSVDTNEDEIRSSDIVSLNSKPVWKSLIIKAGFKLMSDYESAENRYYIFICSYNEVNNKTLFLGLTSGENFGWGVCSKYLKNELSKRLNIINLDEHNELVKAVRVNGPVFHALNNNDFKGIYPARGTVNIGYTFFEYELNEIAVKNAVNYDLILGGSSWNQQKLNEREIKNTGVLIQGVDPELFYPGEKENKGDLFVIFSGGKFELRKGQDLVLKAVKILQEKYSDIVLINAWYNMWSNTIQSMGISKYINFEYKGETWKNFIINLCKINGIDGEKVLTLPVTPNNKLRELYLNTDIGLFPNRCEGGTNLVLMEYMACGKPVIASYNSGHKDILTGENSIRLERMHEFKLYDGNKKIIADWEEPDLDEIVAKLEYAYFNRSNIKQIGKNAAQFMKQFSWKQSADSLLKYFKL